MDLQTAAERAMGGDAEAFRALVVSCHRLVRAICATYAATAADTDDLVQDVFLRVHHDLPQLRDPDRIRPWLRTVATNTCRMWLRRSPPTQVPLEESQEPVDPLPRELAHKSEVSRIVHDVLSRVTPCSREVLALHYLADASEGEIAELLNLPRSTVKSRLYEARQQAKRYLLPVVQQFLLLAGDSEAVAERIVERCGSPGCHCPDTLMEGR